MTKLDLSSDFCFKTIQSLGFIKLNEQRLSHE